MARYAELHCHSNFSFRDGASFPEDLVRRAVDLGYAALAITDHHGFYGAPRFRLAAEGVIDYLGRGEYQVDAPRSELPSKCPLRTGGGVPRGCEFHPKFLSRMLEAGTLTHGGPCSLSRACTL